MTPWDIRDRILRDIAALPRLRPDPARSERVRAQCRARLASRQRDSQPIERFGRRILAPAVFVFVCGVYVVSVLSAALRVSRGF